MRRSYLMVYNTEFGTREGIRKIIDDMPEILNWKYELPYSFFLVSELDANDLATRLRGKTGSKGRVIITEIGLNKQGWLDPETWKMVNEKSDPG